MHVLFLSGSPNRLSKTNAVLKTVQQSIEVPYSTSTIDILDVPADDLMQARFQSPAIEKVKGEIENADIVVIGSPVYKASVPGVLKALLDLLPEGALIGKVVLPVATGGSIAHYLSLQYSLLPVLHILGATSIIKPVFVLSEHVQLENGVARIQDTQSLKRIDEAISKVKQSLKQASYTNV
ncbi:NADPH-dependent FMN reductase [Shouchella miscanthi]|uniref:NADPH-dependent FMN reductase n=1 Tax=Shouchella miscanthi TaxID=2598861 RepID=A0ABU6NKV6_9BACI|nr:NADPH-dependent FMN reductase [Shouchella miscanthi]MED4128816.1 NADPH-dependent FMN reductase [Shouchella miscanthi]